ncbi:hypothetical protein ACHHYP_14080 [Achlya hypogyna]|uniref:Uncharacterized protein n=1 Tax=Achlya hypogyna TaxID=1202772 RepID=A0A1V9YE18_ACHHY|nr:hypothetical protein ACHHYP_14080 [Achlya hypogyna]
MELVPKSSHGVRYAPTSLYPNKKSQMAVMPYSGLDQLSSDEDDEFDRKDDDSPTLPSRRAPATSNQEAESLQSARTSSLAELYDPPPERPGTPRATVLITVRRKVTYEARVRLAADRPPVYVGRYKSEQAAREACDRLLQKTRSL